MSALAGLWAALTRPRAPTAVPRRVYPIGPTVMTVGELLDDYDAAYTTYVAAIEADPLDPRRSWSVYTFIKELEASMGDDPDTEALPPTRIIGDKIVVGGYRAVALGLIAGRNPGVRSRRIRVEFVAHGLHADVEAP